MISGNHSHLCDLCGQEYHCPLVTHCRRDEVDGPPSYCTPCWDKYKEQL
jgi:hypothetical protein